MLECPVQIMQPFAVDVIDPDMKLRRPSRAAGCSPGSACALAGWAVCLALVCGGAEAQRHPHAWIDLRISAGSLTLKADNVSAEEVLRRVAQALDARLSISGDLGAPLGRWDLGPIPVAQAVTEIARPLNILIVQDRAADSSDDYIVREIYVIGRPEADPRQTLQTSSARTQRIHEAAQMLTFGADAEVRRAAAMALGNIGTDESVRALGRALSDGDSRVRIQVIESLGRIGTDEAIRLVGQAALGSSDPEVLAAATRVLEGSTSDRAGALLLVIKAQAQTAAGMAIGSSKSGTQ